MWHGGFKRWVLLLAVVSGLWACKESPAPLQAPQWHSLDLTNGLSPKVVNVWSLPSTRPNHERVGIPVFRGKAVLLFFGYAQCPDVCPTTLARLARAQKLLGKEANKLQVIFITVDPERDTLDFLQRYVTQFDPSFIALRGTLEETRQVAERFKVFFQKVPSPGGGYTVDHSAGVFLIDSHGDVRALMSEALPDDQVRADLQQLLRL